MDTLVKCDIQRPPVREWIAGHMANGKTRLQAKDLYRQFGIAEAWANSAYLVVRYKDNAIPAEMNPCKLKSLVWLSLRRIDKKPVVRWHDMQDIKNQLLGPECEMVQLFPAQSRLVDDSNQYHFYGWNDPEKTFPFGFQK